ncbi:MAG: DNA-formamidopyrimidine glycosylase family protein [Actinomycetota bacterium]
MEKLELPEIETLRRDLEREVVGRKVKSVEVLALKSMPRHKTKKVFETPMVGAKIASVSRRGLALVLAFDNEQTLVVELGEEGRLSRVASKTARDDNTAAVITFTQNGDLRLHDVGGTSAFSLVPTEEMDEFWAEQPPLGLDLHEQPVSWVQFGQLIMSRKTPLKLLLTDSEVFVGIGDIYSNEILFDAGLRHDRMCNELSTQEIRRLYRSVVGIIHDAIKYGGTSLETRPFTDLNGKPGEYTEHLAVYGRAGELSPRSRVPIQKTSFKHQVVYYCNTQV